MSIAGLRPSRRTIVLFDAAILAWVAAWIFAGFTIAREVSSLAELSTTLASAAGAIEQTGDVLRIVGNVPFVGGQVTELAERIERTGADARRNAQESREAVERLSRILGTAVVLVGTLPLAALYVPLRTAWRRETRSIEKALRRDPEGRHLREYLARRAVQTLPYDRLRVVSADPWRDLEAGRFDALADAELRRLGIRRPQRRE